MSVIDTIIVFIKSNAVILLVLIGIVFLLVWLFKRAGKKTLKPVSRAEIERKNFIERNKFNLSPLKFLYRGDKLVGGIKTARKTKIVEKKTGLTAEQMELVVKPAWKIGRRVVFIPLSKENCMFISLENIKGFDMADSKITLERGTIWNLYDGLYYDLTHEEIYKTYIRDANLFVTDLESMSSVYYVKSMEQATFEPDRATQIQSKQLDLEAEKEKRKHLIS